ncbi:hypothetical protein FRC12_019869 [Ceratobasidium sp. 428]|nr:hypothetical protein FRC12_019869 [Ceratobasidium sp. 428]
MPSTQAPQTLSSSPAPVHESQPRPNSPTTTERGTKPHHALYDTPPEGTQQPELERSQRQQTMSRSGRETGRKSNPEVIESHASVAEPNSTVIKSNATSKPASSKPQPSITGKQNHSRTLLSRPVLGLCPKDLE